MTTPALPAPLAGGSATESLPERTRPGGARQDRGRAAVDEFSRFASQLRAVASPTGLATAALFAFLYARPAYLLVRDWWTNPEAGHGLLLAPLALWFAYKSGIRPDARPNRAVGAALLVAGVGFRWLADLAAELFVMRGSMLLALAGLVVWHYGVRQVVRWWLPFTLFALSIPLPEIVLNKIALPLQFLASKIGASLLAWRQIPVLLSGNVIRIPRHELFVAEACSGLRSLTALISLGVLLGAIVLRHPISRLLLLAAVIPVAIVLNGVRVFLTGFLVYFVDPALGEGFMHKTEGMAVFIVAFAIIGALAFGVSAVEQRVLPAPERRDGSRVPEPVTGFPAPEFANG
ncbi:exosortase [Gemmatimonadetes bacterium T265]|nr:exosortase [Gemmatimonadetes bacterium T265]